LRRVVPAVAKRKTEEGGRRHAAQLLCARTTPVDVLAVAVFVAKALEIGCDGIRACMWEKRAPFPGPCQAFAEKARPRMMGAGRRIST
jgi:hypothetical protein